MYIKIIIIDEATIQKLNMNESHLLWHYFQLGRCATYREKLSQKRMVDAVLF